MGATRGGEGGGRGVPYNTTETLPDSTWHSSTPQLAKARWRINGLLAMLSYGGMFYAITEKSRWTPFYQEGKCMASEPTGMRLMTLLSAPSPFAEQFGLSPGTAPFGAYGNVTSTATCTNPNQMEVTTYSEGNRVEMYAPNLTDLFIGGKGLPETFIGYGNLASDVVLAAGGAAEMTQLTHFALPFSALLEMMKISAIQGYSPAYAKSVMPAKTCMSVMGFPMCTETVTEQWCGYFSGPCMLHVLGDDGLPVVPVQYEPAMCAYTKHVCGSKEDMKAELVPSALGLEVVATGPCPPASGLPSTQRCDVISAPGIDPNTFEPKLIDPPMQLTANAQRELDETLTSGERMINIMLMSAIVLNTIGGTVDVVMCIVYYRLWRSRQAPPEAGAARELPTVLSAPRSGAAGDPSKKVASQTESDFRV